MFRLETEEALLNAFRPRDRKHVERPKDLHFPLFVRDYLAWVDPTGTRAYLVFTEPHSHRPMGIAFRRDQQGSATPVSRMCDWCHAYGSAQEIGLLTAEVSSRRRVGVCLCMDLRCGEKLETAANLAGRSPREQAHKLLDRIARFAHEGLGVDFVPEA
ncbi:MAG: FBP domain-containing protein [Myxococcaceae bacterium]|nr:FBP domain-containing protein [Myxococcaceae bacterium]MCI0670182.1 FBP domain-containing protein [Myxococcaceae bacterium]